MLNKIQLMFYTLNISQTQHSYTKFKAIIDHNQIFPTIRIFTAHLGYSNLEK